MKRWYWTFAVVMVVVLFTYLVSRKVASMKGVSDAVKALARAIATAEGFYVEGSRPKRNNNPGDLTQDTTGKATNKDAGEGITFMVYKTEQDGWDALYKQVSLMFSGKSSYYNSGMSILEVAQRWTTTDQIPWAQNVARALNVDYTAKLSEIADMFSGRA